MYIYVLLTFVLKIFYTFQLCNPRSNNEFETLYMNSNRQRPGFEIIFVKEKKKRKIII